MSSRFPVTWYDIISAKLMKAGLQLPEPGLGRGGSYPNHIDAVTHTVGFPRQVEVHFPSRFVGVTTSHPFFELSLSGFNARREDGKGQRHSIARADTVFEGSPDSESRWVHKTTITLGSPFVKPAV
jgi:hypothetical protein